MDSVMPLGKDLGSTLTVPNGITYRIGTRKPDESDESSNWQAERS